jgi:hypothetical protein
LILVTSEKKSDWWSLFGNQRIGPRREMVQEFHQVTGGKLYHLYTSDAFLKYASDHLEIQARPEVIEDVKNVRKQRTAADHEATSYIALNEVRTEIDRIDSLLKEILPLAASARSGDSDKQQLSELKAMLQGIDLEDIAGQFDMTYHDAVASGGRLSPRMRRRLRLLSRRLAGIRKIYDEVYSVLVGATDSYPHF